jgi:hypothetical protein
MSKTDRSATLGFGPLERPMGQPFVVAPIANGHRNEEIVEDRQTKVAEDRQIYKVTPRSSNVCAVIQPGKNSIARLVPIS